MRISTFIAVKLSPSQLVVTDNDGFHILTHAVQRRNLFAVQLLCERMPAEALSVKSRWELSPLQHLARSYPLSPITPAFSGELRLPDQIIDCIASHTTLDDLRLSLATATEEGVGEVLQRLRDMISIREQAMVVQQECFKNVRPLMLSSVRPLAAFGLPSDVHQHILSHLMPHGIVLLRDPVPADADLQRIRNHCAGVFQRVDTNC